MEAWTGTDYYVVYISQQQRDALPHLFAYLSQYQPVHTVSFGGVGIARIYDLRTIPPGLAGDHPVITCITDKANCSVSDPRPYIEPRGTTSRARWAARPQAPPHSGPPPNYGSGPSSTVVA